MLRIGPRLGLRVDERLLRWHFLATLPLAWLGFPLGVPQGSEGLLGAVARLSTVALLVPGLLGAAALWKAGEGGRDTLRLALRWLGFWLALDVVLAALGAAGLAELALRSRHLAVLYLHVRLLGFFSQGLMLCVFTRLRQESRSGFAPGLWLHNLGLVVMLVGLALAGAPATGWMLPQALLGAALPLAAAGGLVTASAGLLWFVQLHANRPSPLQDPTAVQR